MPYPHQVLAVLSIVGFIAFGGFLGYLAGRTRTRVEHQAIRAMWAETRTPR